MSWWMAIPAVLQAGSAIAGGQSALANSKIEARQLEDQANAEYAQSAANAADVARMGRLRLSAATAALAHSGGSLSDPTAINILADLEADSEYRVLSELYSGKTRKQSMMFEAKVTRHSGKSARAASYLQAATAIGSAYSDYKTFNAKYGGRYSGYGYGGGDAGYGYSDGTLD